MNTHRNGKWIAGALAAALFLQAGCDRDTAASREAAAATDPATSHAAPARQREIPLEGGMNFRDLGGYATEDGHTVKWGLLYRTASMQDLTPADFAHLRSLGIQVVCDLRDSKERTAAPVPWPEGEAPAILADDYAMPLNALKDVLRDPAVDVEKARTAMIDGMYRHLPFQFADQYRRMFGELLAERVPLVFNCSAGKDRTGVAAALILDVLGVPPQTVMEDYLLSNRHFRYVREKQPEDEAAFWDSLPPGVLDVVVGVEPAFLQAAFDAIDARPGGRAAYYRETLGLSDQDIARLRALYLE